MDGNQHRIHYRPVGSGTWTEIQANGANASPRTLTDLTPGTEYEVAISRRCPPPGNHWSSVGNSTRFWTQTAPTGVNDYGIAYNGTIQYLEVTANDYDVNGDKVTMSPFFQPELVSGSGTVGQFLNNYLSFQPDANFEGEAVIRYRPYDGFTEGNLTNVVIEVKTARNICAAACGSPNLIADGCVILSNCLPMGYTPDFNCNGGMFDQSPTTTDRCEICIGPSSANCTIADYTTMPFISLDACNSNVILVRAPHKGSVCQVRGNTFLSGEWMTVWGNTRMLNAGTYCFSFWAFNPTPRLNPTPSPDNLCESQPFIQATLNGTTMLSTVVAPSGIWQNYSFVFTLTTQGSANIEIDILSDGNACFAPLRGNDLVLDQFELHDLNQSQPLGFQVTPEYINICESGCATFYYGALVNMNCGLAGNCPVPRLTVLPTNGITINPMAGTITYCGNTSQTFIATLTEGNGKCAESQIFSANVIPRPRPMAVASPATICGLAETVVLNAYDGLGTPGITYVWQPGEMTGPIVTVIPIQTTTYTVTATNAQGCSNTAEVTVLSNECCVPGTVLIDQDIYSSAWFGQNGSMHGQNYFFKNANFYVDSELTVSHSRLTFTEGSGMYITGGARLINSEFTGCAGEKWAGIFAQSHFSATRCTIRNAEVGIHSNVEMFGGGQGGIFNNLIIAEGAPGDAGIRIANLTYGRISCNRIDNYQTGLHFVNPNPLPQPGSIQIQANAFKNYSTGILIQGGDVGEQAYFDGLGTVIGPADNRWLDPNQPGPERVVGSSTDWHIRSFGSEYDAGPYVTAIPNNDLSPLDLCSWSGEVGQGWRKANGDKPSSVPEIFLYPNPAGNDVQLLVNLGDSEASVRATFYNSKGERALNIEGLRSNEIRTLSLQGIAQGLYVMELLLPDGNTVYRKLQIAR
jgi:hypothetical protein